MITLLHGENDYEIATRLDEIADKSHVAIEQYDGDDVEPAMLADLCMGATLFASERLIAIRGATRNKSLWQNIEQWIERIPEQTHIVLIESSPDKRTKTYKLIAKLGAVHEHKPLEAAELTSWLANEFRAEGIDVSRESVRYMVDRVGHDQWRLKGELEKLVLTGRPVTEELIRDVTEPHPEASAFELLDSLFRGDSDKAHELFELIREREDPYQFFGLLSSQVLALQALSLSGQRRLDEVAKDLALHPFVLRKLSPIASKLGKARVSVIIDKLATCDTRIKTTGAEPWPQLYRTLMSITI